MKIAYLIDNEGLGGGMEYIRRQIAAHPGDEARIFASDRGECTAAKLNEWGAELIHVNHLKALCQLFQSPFRRPHGQVTFTVHGIHLRKYGFLPQTLANRLKRALRRRLEQWLYRKCDRLVALTPTDAKDIRRLYGEGLKVDVEPNTVDPAEFAHPVGNLRYRPDEFAFVCIARFDFQKGQDVLLEAIALVQDELRRTQRKTLLVGGGHTLPAMRRLAAAKGIADLVEFAGEIPKAGAYMTCGKVLVAPSRWEGMPYLLLEAVARGRPVIAADCPGNRDVLAGYARGQLFKAASAPALAALMANAMPARRTSK
ncbi:MAG: glycosyltransferase [Kiritimatiellae bacterium]|nr:glycosyltransferase [Kiritimatiellia bacterium]